MSEQNYEEDLEDINTGNGFERDMLATTSDRLKKTVIELRRLGETTTSLRASISSLEGTIVKLDMKNEALQNRIVWLTIAGVILAALQIIQAIDIIDGWLRH